MTLQQANKLIELDGFYTENSIKIHNTCFSVLVFKYIFPHLGLENYRLMWKDGSHFWWFTSKYCFVSLKNYQQNSMKREWAEKNKQKFLKILCES